MTNKKNLKIYICGHNGLVGSSIYKLLQKRGYKNLIVKTRKELNLLDQKKVLNFFTKHKPDQVYLCAGKVGGILSNYNFPADFIYENLMILTNVIHSSYVTGTKKILFMGSSCVYPKFSTQPIKENSLLSGYLEKTNEPYAIAKIAGLKLCESYNKQFSKNKIDYRSIMPTNLYGKNDNYDLNNSHVLPALIRKIYEAKVNKKKSIELWGTGKPKREFLHVNDLADASIHIMNISKKQFSEIAKFENHLNIGSGQEFSINTLAKKIAKIIKYEGKINFDKINPDGTPRKILNTSKLKKLGWKTKIPFDQGLKSTCEDFIKNYNKIIN